MAEILTEMGMPQEMVLFYIVYLFATIGIMLVFSVVGYIFQGLGMYTLAKRRGIHKPWLAWVPVGNMWLLGCISDQFRYRAYGETTNRRRKLLVRNILLQVVAWVLCVAMIYLIVCFGSGRMSEEAFLSALLVLLLGTYGMIALAVVAMILQYKCLFDLYRSCVPSKAVLFLLLSILIGVPTPFLIFACRNKDFGMVPKQETAPQYRPELPGYEEY